METIDQKISAIMSVLSWMIPIGIIFLFIFWKVINRPGKERVVNIIDSTGYICKTETLPIKSKKKVSKRPSLEETKGSKRNATKRQQKRHDRKKKNTRKPMYI